MRVMIIVIIVIIRSVRELKLIYTPLQKSLKAGQRTCRTLLINNLPKTTVINNPPKTWKTAVGPFSSIAVKSKNSAIHRTNACLVEKMRSEVDMPIDVAK